MIDRAIVIPFRLGSKNNGKQTIPTNGPISSQNNVPAKTPKAWRSDIPIDVRIMLDVNLIVSRRVEKAISIDSPLHENFYFRILTIDRQCAQSMFMAC